MKNKVIRGRRLILLIFLAGFLLKSELSFADHKWWDSGNEQTLTARIVVPRDGWKVERDKLLVRAVVRDPQNWWPFPPFKARIKEVRFQYQPIRKKYWLDLPVIGTKHPNPDLSFPYFIIADASALPGGECKLRAVLIDIEGVVDPSPESITITVVRGIPDPERRIMLNLHFEGGKITLNELSVEKGQVKNPRVGDLKYLDAIKYEILTAFNRLLDSGIFGDPTIIFYDYLESEEPGAPFSGGIATQDNFDYLLWVPLFKNAVKIKFSKTLPTGELIDLGELKILGEEED